TSVFGSRSGERVASDLSKPGSAWPMNMIAAEPRDFATWNVSCIHAMSAALRAANSAGSGDVSHKLLQEPWMFKGAYATPREVHRRFSTHGSGALAPPAFSPRHSGVVCTSWCSLCCPRVNGVLKKTWRSCESRSSDEKPPFDARSQSVQSLSPGVNTAGARSELKYPSERTYRALSHGLFEPALRPPSCTVKASRCAFMSAIRFGTPTVA